MIIIIIIIIIILIIIVSLSLEVLELFLGYSPPRQRQQRCQSQGGEEGVLTRHLFLDELTHSARDRWQQGKVYRFDIENGLGISPRREV